MADEERNALERARATLDALTPTTRPGQKRFKRGGP